jgi:Tol biopolymer transport system component
MVFRSMRNGQSDLFIGPANGAGEEQPLLVTAEGKTPLDWSRDGHYLLYSVADPKTESDLWALPMSGANASPIGRSNQSMTGEHKPFPVVHTAFDETQGQFSPDVRWLAYTSNETGRTEVYVRPFPEAGGKLQVSTGGGSQPRWRPDGKELFYVAPDGKLMAAPLSIAPQGRAVVPGTPVPLFQAHLASGNGISLTGWQSRALYAVTSDGRFLMNATTEGADASPITIVLNWQAALKK